MPTAQEGGCIASGLRLTSELIDLHVHLLVGRELVVLLAMAFGGGVVMVVHRVGFEGSGSRVGCVMAIHGCPSVRASRKYLLGYVTPEDYRRSLV